MTQYATIEDMERARGADHILALSDKDRTGTRIDAALNEALERASSRLIEAVVTDGTGIEDDGLVLAVDNDGDIIDPSRRGVSVAFAGGYRETGGRQFGTYLVEDVEKTAPKRSLTIVARAGAPGDTLKERRYRGHEAQTVRKLVDRIAGEHGLTSAVGPDLADIVISYRAQIGESDMHLLTSLALRLGAVAAVKERHLVFARKGKAASVTGKPLPPVVIGLDDLYGEDAFLLRGTARPRYGTIRAFWHDPDTANRRMVEEAGDGALLQLPETYQSEAEARAAIEGERNNRDREEERLTVVIHGRIEAQADAPLIVAGIDRDGDGTWSIEVAEHVFSGAQIYQTTIEAVRKGLAGR